MSIHKSQGATLDRAQFQIDRTLFEYGQAYVACSRCRNITSMYLTNFDPRGIKTHSSVVQFYKKQEHPAPPKRQRLDA